MKNNSKSQWFSQNFWMVDITCCITNKNKAPKLEKKKIPTTTEQELQACNTAVFNTAYKATEAAYSCW